MNKFLAGILTFLLWIMPWWTGLYNTRNRLAFDATAICNEVIRCVKTRDTTTLESMMRPWLKNNEGNLSGKIEALLDCIDGDIIEIRISDMEGTRNTDGIYSVERIIIIKTAGVLYNLRVYYDVTNSKNSKDVGISWFQLAEIKSDGSGFISLAEIKVP